jgi:quercetin dioxygenase-like cupin family protein
MLPYGEFPTAPVPNRPIISNKTDGAEGKGFTVTFLPGQELPAHRNGHEIEITARKGSGEMTLGDQPATTLIAGESVNLEPNLLHAVRAGNDGLELRVRLIPKAE